MNGYTTVDMQLFDLTDSSDKIDNIYNTMLDAIDTNKPIYLYNLSNNGMVVAPVNPFAYVTASDVPKAIIGEYTLSFASDDTVSVS